MPFKNVPRSEFALQKPRQRFRFNIYNFCGLKCSLILQEFLNEIAIFIWVIASVAKFPMKDKAFFFRNLHDWIYFKLVYIYKYI